ncbi:hypothetical protein [Sorangium sp. So ce1153]|uniref:hypothetical protein n=1 Tax=Sorangium sp. So ce1153 TaxID=3133333 RepID=UPI003F63B4ED
MEGKVGAVRVVSTVSTVTMRHVRYHGGPNGAIRLSGLRAAGLIASVLAGFRS